jgi:hypothetical protein
LDADGVVAAVPGAGLEPALRLREKGILRPFLKSLMALFFFVFNRSETSVLGEDSTNPSYVIRKTYGLI